MLPLTDERGVCHAFADPCNRFLRRRITAKACSSLQRLHAFAVILLA
jgi:hypothetical protein